MNAFRLQLLVGLHQRRRVGVVPGNGVGGGHLGGGCRQGVWWRKVSETLIVPTVTIKLRLGYPLGVVLFLTAMDIDYGVLPLSRSYGLAQGTGRSVRA